MDNDINQIQQKIAEININDQQDADADALKIEESKSIE